MKEILVSFNKTINSGDMCIPEDMQITFCERNL